MMASLAELTDNPFVQNTIDSVALRDATDLPKTRIIVRPQNTPDNEPVKQDDSKLQNIIDQLFGLNGKERYQLWPEKLIRDAISAPHDVMTGEIPQYVIDPITGEARTSPQMIKAGVDASSLAGSGGLAGAGSEAGVALGSAPFLRPALKYGEKLYKGKPGQQHMDVIPADLYPTFQKQAMSGEDISNFNFGFLNHKGQFLSREDALKYAIDNGLVDPHFAQYGVLTSTLMSDTAKPGTAINALANSQPKFDFSIGANSGTKFVKIGPTEITYGVNPKNNDVELSLIRTDKNKRNEGNARNAIEQFLNEADNNNKRVLLNADPMDKSTNKNKLKDFYQSLGFVRNKGSNKDFSTRAEYIRDPILKSDTSKPGAALAAVANTNKPFYSAVENAVAAAKQPKADAQQWLSFLKNQPGVKQEELAHLGLDKLQGSTTKDDLLKAVQERQPQINDIVKGDLKFDKSSPYALPEVIRAAREAGDNPGELELVLANDGNAYRALTKKFPKLAEDEDWASKVSKSVFGGDTMPSGTTKYHNYQLPGGENYREMLLTLPDKHAQYIKNIDKQFEDVNTELRILSNKGKQNTPEYDQLSKQYSQLYNERKQAYEKTGTAYQSSHWDEPNVLAHIRMNDRTIDGKKTLHLEEIQSDWHQAGRKQGYKGSIRTKKEVQNDIDSILRELETRTGTNTPTEKDWSNHPDLNSKFEKLAEERKIAPEPTAGVPDAPFKKTWDELALKKAITEAVKNGYDQISWTPGEAQAARYDLSKQVDKIAIPMVNENGTRSVRVDAKGGSPFKLMVNKDGIVEGHGGSSSQFSGKPLSDVVGKEMAEKIMKLEKPDEFSGDGLKVGGQGMKSFYDKMLVDKMNALTKKYGGKVEKKNIEPKYPSKEANEQGKIPVHTLRITPELREHVLKNGFPLFSAGVPVFTPVEGNPFEGNK